MKLDYQGKEGDVHEEQTNHLISNHSISLLC